LRAFVAWSEIELFEGRARNGEKRRHGGESTGLKFLAAGVPESLSRDTRKRCPVLIEAVAGAVVLVVVLSVLGARRTRRKADSIRRFSKAVSALRTIADEPRPEPPVEDHTIALPNVRVLDEVVPLHEARERRARASGRRTARPDPELVARRPVIAKLPSISAPSSDGPGTQVG
jgi:hypothetical protein